MKLHYVRAFMCKVKDSRTRVENEKNEKIHCHFV